MPADAAWEPAALISALLAWALVAGALLLPMLLILLVPRSAELWPRPRGEQGPRFLVEVGLIVVIAYLVEGIAGVILASRLANEELAGQRLWWLLLAKLLAAPLALAAALLVPWVVSRTRPAQLGLTLRQFRANLVLGYAGWLIVTPIVLAVYWLALQAFEREKHPVETVLADSPGLPTWIIVLGAVLLAAPLVEELVFRGVVQPWVTRACLPVLGRGAAWMGILVSSAFFAAIHPWPTPIPLFVLSLALGWLRHWTGSLVAPVTAHVLFNVVGLLPLMLRQTGAW